MVTNQSRRDYGETCPECDQVKDPEAEVIQAWRCEGGCDLTEESSESPLYECGDCGDSFTRDNSADGASNRCPSCNKFAARIADVGCDDCGESEAIQVDAVACECGTIFEVTSAV